MGSEDSHSGYMEGGYVPQLPPELNHYVGEYLDPVSQQRAASTSRGARAFELTLQNVLNGTAEDLIHFLQKNKPAHKWFSTVFDAFMQRGTPFDFNQLLQDTTIQSIPEYKARLLESMYESGLDAFSYWVSGIYRNYCDNRIPQELQNLTLAEVTRHPHDLLEFRVAGSILSNRFGNTNVTMIEVFQENRQRIAESFCKEMETRSYDPTLSLDTWFTILYDLGIRCWQKENWTSKDLPFIRLSGAYDQFVRSRRQ